MNCENLYTRLVKPDSKSLPHASVKRDASSGAHAAHETPASTCFLKTPDPSQLEGLAQLPTASALVPWPDHQAAGTYSLSLPFHGLCHILTPGRCLAARCLPCPSPHSGHLLPMDKVKVPQLIGQTLAETQEYKVTKAKKWPEVSACEEWGEKGQYVPFSH